MFVEFIIMKWNKFDSHLKYTWNEIVTFTLYNFSNSVNFCMPSLVYLKNGTLMLDWKLHCKLTWLYLRVTNRFRGVKLKKWKRVLTLAYGKYWIFSILINKYTNYVICGFCFIQFTNKLMSLNFINYLIKELGPDRVQMKMELKLASRWTIIEILYLFYISGS